ncbi:hypothetical protein [Proteiniclasticum sp.]|uniref:hypothetical protein n=1 Tax=Proteiniclasticum sp. TaxID=2053595 RepID=UPI0028998AE0|nr:hypothetical protein [Proteiniclasticum sp.]
MDHIMTGIEEFLPIYLNDFLEEQLKHDHKTLKENPVYPELKLIVDSINLYRDFLSLPRLSLEAMVKEGLKGVRYEHFNTNA